MIAKRRRRAVWSDASLAIGTLLLTACSLTTNFDGLAGGAAAGTRPESADGGADGGGVACAPSAPSATDVTGHWAATVHVALFGGAVQGAVGGQADLKEECGNVTGTMTLQACIMGGKVVGTIDDDGNFNATITSGSVTATAKGTLTNADEIDGDFTLAAGSDCPAQDGQFQLLRPDGGS
jgi:hypothetical protein